MLLPVRWLRGLEEERASLDLLSKDAFRGIGGMGAREEGDGDVAVSGCHDDLWRLLGDGGKYRAEKA